MNQKNIFTAISVVLILQGLVFFFMGSQLMASAFPASDEACRHLLSLLFEVVAALSLAVGLIAYATRTTPGAVWAFTVGTAVLLIVTLKHLLVDDINVPIPAVIIQVLIVLACGYLMMGQKKA